MHLTFTGKAVGCEGFEMQKHACLNVNGEEKVCVNGEEEVCVNGERNRALRISIIAIIAG